MYTPGQYDARLQILSNTDSVGSPFAHIYVYTFLQRMTRRSETNYTTRSCRTSNIAALSFTTHLTMEKFSKRMRRLWNSFCDCFQLFEKNLALVSYYIAKQEDFPKIVQLNRKFVNSFDADCMFWLSFLVVTPFATNSEQYVFCNVAVRSR